MSDKIKAKYTIDNGNIMLSKVSNFITCEICGQNLAINNEGILLIKTFASLMDIQNNELTLKCGKCKSFNTFKIRDANKRYNKCLLAV